MVAYGGHKKINKREQASKGKSGNKGWRLPLGFIISEGGKCRGGRKGGEGEGMAAKVKLNLYRH